MGHTAAMKFGMACCFLVFIGGFILPLGIASTVIGKIQMSTCHNMSDASGICTCDYTDTQTGLNVAKVLFGLGIEVIILGSTLFLCIFIALILESPFPLIPIFIILICHAGFGISWFVVTGIVQFRANIQCIQNSTPHVIFDLVMWCITAATIIKSYCLGRNNTTTS